MFWLKNNKESTHFDWRFFLKISALIAAAFILAGAIYVLANLKLPAMAVIGGQKIKLEIASTPEQKAMGLSGREILGENHGMMFVYDGYYQPAFWMKDMLFPLDIIWIRDRMIVGMSEDILPGVAGQELAIYRPPVFVDKVLEVNAGFVAQNKIKIGDEIDFPIW